jgi:hypothetical protein
VIKRLAAAHEPALLHGLPTLAFRGAALGHSADLARTLRDVGLVDGVTVHCVLCSPRASPPAASDFFIQHEEATHFRYGVERTLGRSLGGGR